MNKANFTFFHLKESGKIGFRVVTSLFLFFSLFAATNLSAQTVSCNGHLNISPDPASCDAVITPAAVGTGGTVVFIEGISDAYITNNGTASVTIDADAIPDFQATGMVMDLTYNLILGSVDAPTNQCWGTFTLEDKAPPTLRDGVVETITCSELDEYVWPTMTVADGDITECTEPIVEFNDVLVTDQCVADTIFRTYTVTDRKGNEATVTDTLELLPESLTTLELPPNWDGLADRTVSYVIVENGFPSSYTFDIEGLEPIGCDDGGVVWNQLENGYPSPFDSDDEELIGAGAPGIFTCGTIHATWEDLRVDVCDADCEQTSPSYKLVRQWTILDWCEGNVLEHNQIIKVLDTEDPEIDPIDDVTISTDLWGCNTSWTLPTPTASDNCTADDAITFEWSVSDGTIVDGVLSASKSDSPVTVTVTATDCCGNTDVETFLVTILDLVPPVVVSDAHTVVSLSDYNSEGIAKVFAPTFDDGSFDGCGPIDFWVRRMLPEGGGENACVGEAEGRDFLDEDGDDIETSGFDDFWFKFIHFCCEDIQFDEDGNQIPIMVEFLVCDDGVDMDGVPELTDNCNSSMVEVIVQDKLPPACAAPADETINCIDLVAYQDLINAGPLGADDAARVDAIFGDAAGAATCNVEVVQELTSEEDCGDGEIERTITVTNTVNGLSTTCTQIITVEADPDRNFLVCEDITFPVGSAEYEAGYDWCETNPFNIGDDVDVEEEDFPAIEVNDCVGVTITQPEIDIDDLCSEVGISLTVDTFNFAGGGCKKLLAHWEIIDQCLFEENYLYYNGSEYEINPFVAENGYFEIYVEYDLFDTEAPVIECGAGEIVGCTEVLTGPITASATDNCTDPAFFGWSWKLDVDFRALGGEAADGDPDFEGEGNSVSPSDIGLESFPEGEHTITWIVNDGCGNIATESCTFPLEIEDMKAPTPYCYDGLSSAVMLMNGVTLWAEDFNAGSFDDCGGVFVTIVPEVDVEGLTDEEAYEASLNLVYNVATDTDEYGWTFGCDYIPNGISATIDVRMYATDDAGNYDYCVASFRLQDNLGGCEDVEGALAAIGGNVATEDGQMVDEVSIEAMAANPEFPKYTTTGTNGEYAFYNNPTAYSYEITPERNTDYLGGGAVSTLDLVLIQKHILNIEPLDSPYKRIAADVNNDADIRASDLLQLRKLILGIYSEDRLPNNNSWRFVDANFQFADEANPFPFAEVATIDELSTDEMAENFVAVKVGDVNNSIDLRASNATVRNSKDLTFELNDASYAAGELVELNFRSSDFANVYGYQFTLEFAKDLSFAGIESGALDLTEANFGLNRIAEGVITTSFDAVRGVNVNANDVLFTLKFTANNPVELKDVVNISSKVTSAEAYTGAELEVNNVNLAFRSGEGTEIANTYALYQNEPNPFRGVTNISFNLPEAAEATLSIFDVTGKVIYRTTADYAKGLNTVRVNDITTSGVLYYQLDSDDYTATKKMIIIE